MHFQNTTWLLTLAIFECLCQTGTSTSSHRSPKSSSKDTPSKEVLDKVEDSLMSLFGFKGRPKINRKNIIIPDEIKLMYEKQSGLRFKTPSIPKMGGYLGSANTIRSFVHVESPIDEKFAQHSKFRLKFDVSSVPKNEIFKAAELSIKRTQLDEVTPENSAMRVIVEDILKLGVKGKSETIKRIIDSKKIQVGGNSTIKLDLTEAVHRWLADPKSNHGILVSIKGLNSKHKGHVRLKRSLTDSGTDDWKREQPILYAYTDDPKHSQEKNIRDTIRRRRAAKKHFRTKNANTPCSRHKMYVDFSDVGWDDWIVAPPGYDAYYCYGECRWPLPPHLNTTNHAIIQSLVNSVNPMRVPNPCCVPTHLNSISMLYLDDETKVVLKNYKDMVVIGCGCR